MAETEQGTYEGWTILELMGHRRLGGYVREQEVAGAAFLRIDVPSEPPVTQFYAPAAVYAMTPTTEEIARALAARMRPAPVHAYELTPLRPDRTIEAAAYDHARPGADEDEDAVDQEAWGDG